VLSTHAAPVFAALGDPVTWAIVGRLEDDGKRMPDNRLLSAYPIRCEAILPIPHCRIDRAIARAFSSLFRGIDTLLMPVQPFGV
jgi:hypothetical protein